MLLSKKLKFLTWPVMPGLGWPLPPLQLHWIHFSFCFVLSFLGFPSFPLKATGTLYWLSHLQWRLRCSTQIPSVDVAYITIRPASVQLHSVLCSVAALWGIQCYVEAILTHFWIWILSVKSSEILEHALGAWGLAYTQSYLPPHFCLLAMGSWLSPPLFLLSNCYDPLPPTPGDLDSGAGLVSGLGSTPPSLGPPVGWGPDANEGLPLLLSL